MLGCALALGGVKMTDVGATKCGETTAAAYGDNHHHSPP